MSDHIRKTITDFQVRLNEQVEAVNKTKATINGLCEILGDPPLYKIVDEQTAPTITTITSDHFYRKPLATAAKEYLQMRGAARLGPATLSEIYKALTTGGFQHTAKNDANAKRSLAINLSKNSAAFERMPDGKSWGLVEWYGDGKPRRTKQTADNGSSNNDDEPANTENDAVAVVSADEESGSTEREINTET